MNRDNLLSALSHEIETLARFHIQHGLDKTECFERKRASIASLIHEHQIDVKNELDPLSLYFYRRYFG